MVINGVNIIEYFNGAVEFLNYELPNPSYIRQITTTDNDRKIVNKRDSIGIHDMKVQLVLYASKEDAYIIQSDIASRLGNAIVNFGGNLSYRVQISAQGQPTNLTPTMWLYEFNLQILDKMGEEQVITTTYSTPIVLTNSGTYKTPIVIEVTPTTNIEEFSVYGFGKHTSSYPLTITKASGATYLPLNKKIIIDGETPRVLQETTSGFDNKFKDSNILSFPEILVGQTTLTFTSSGSIDVDIRYKPRYV